VSRTSPFDPRTGTRRTWSVEALPVGTVRLHIAHRRGRGKRREVVRIRRIKVSLTGPVSRRWMDYATWWWHQNRGLVPAGKCVLHRDGNLLNDDPSNLMLGTAADRIALWHLRDPKRSEEQLARAHRGTAAFNRQRAELRRLVGWLPCRWYPVDFERRVVLNAPCRKKLQAYRAAGFEPGTTREGPALAKAMGFPGRTASEACILAALLGPNREPRWMTAAAVLADANAARQRRGWLPLTLGWFRSAASRLRRDGLLRPRRGRIAEYAATYAALDGELPCPWVPVLGRDLDGAAFTGFAKLHPDGAAIGRDVPAIDAMAPLQALLSPAR
jgi:hypothetical protein